VQIRTPTGLGSGFIIHPAGHVITNAHVISGEYAITVTLFRRSPAGLQKVTCNNVRIVALDPRLDLALLKIEDPAPPTAPTSPAAPAYPAMPPGASTSHAAHASLAARTSLAAHQAAYPAMPPPVAPGTPGAPDDPATHAARPPVYPTVPLGDSDALTEGQPVFAIGSPLGLDRTVSQGIISSRNRPLDGQLYIQTTTQLNPGNSGGPLFNLRGEVVGVNNMKPMRAGIEGLNFAIPSSVLKTFLLNRDAFAFDARNPNSGYRYTAPPRPNPRSPRPDPAPLQGPPAHPEPPPAPPPPPVSPPPPAPPPLY
ncbi:MAG: trypsin-like peptidase domain-containing protein, partial [Opitutaceae bacterium]|jgi:S1-C subfamily serine protease|nr:trypsin-like peptidase domain-containing protein [Opitutaceae bacterium]